jgi:hypothetical protein
MKEQQSPEMLSQMQFMLEELKKALREEVFETERQRSAILGSPRQSDSWPEIFVLMPFTPQLKLVYDDHIKKAISESELKLRVGRADELFGATSIMSDIWSAINAARIVIADCTGRNPNVFYEIGLAHAIGTHTILISQSLDDIPFDLRHLRIVIYEYTPRGVQAFETALIQTIRECRGSNSART